MNPVQILLTLLATSSTLLLPFLLFSPNRFITGQTHTLWQLSGSALLLYLGLLFSQFILAINWHKFSNSIVTFMSVVIISSQIILLFYFIASYSQQLMLGASSIARVSIASSFWLGLCCSLMSFIDTWQKLNKRQYLLVLLAIGLVGIFIYAEANNHFEQLSLIKEYQNHYTRFWQAVIQHLWLVLLALLPTTLFGLTMGGLAWRYTFLNRWLLRTLSVLQTIPSLALFALLMGPLAWLSFHYPELKKLGVSGIGVAPAVIALILYTLLPIVRNTYVGLKSVPEDSIEAAKGMGMNSREIFFKVIFPLALPVILSGLRIVIIQLIGLTVVAGLIGAGGLGRFVWEGLGQYALDLVLLGAIPTIILALIADMIMQMIIYFCSPIKWSK